MVYETRNFDGKRYTFAFAAPTKFDANRRKKTLKEEGYYVRVVKVGTKSSIFKYVLYKRRK